MYLLVTAGFLGFITFKPEIVNAARIIYVDDDYPFEDLTHKKTIQAGVNAAVPGETVFVFNGTYNENVVVNKVINLTGMNRDNTTIDGGGNGDTVYIASDLVNITGFTVTGGGNGGRNAGIELDKVQNCRIINNSVFSNNKHGIYLNISSNNYVINNIVFSNYWGIYLEESSNNMMTNNNVTSNNQGIDLFSSSNNIVKDNNFSNNGIGPCLESANNNVITNNYVSNQGNGIGLGGSHYNIITDNTVLSTEWWGIHLIGKGIPSNNNIIANNYISSCGSYGIFLFASSDNKIISNTVNNCSDSAIFLDGDFGPPYSSDNNTIKGNNVSWNFAHGIHFTVASRNNTVTNNEVSNNPGLGIYLQSSINNCVEYNNVSVNFGGIYLESAHDSVVTGNNVSSNYEHGISNVGSSKVDFTGNNVFLNSDDGIYLYSLLDNSFTDNNIFNNYNGIHVNASLNINITNNNFINDGVFIEGNHLDHFNSHTMPDNNIVNGDPLYYYKNSSGIVLDRINVGELILANCTHVEAKNLQISDTDVGIELAYSSDINITNNNISSNNYGIYFYSSANNNIIDNLVFSNLNYGIFLSISSGNLIYHNAIINNAHQAYEDVNQSSWNDTYLSGGNYWSDYDGFDFFHGPKQDIPGSDGIGDTPYMDIDGGSGALDYYPLMNITGNYLFLYEGWNLISLPHIQPYTRLSSVLSSIVGSYDAVQWFNASDKLDPWKHNHTAKPQSLNDLHTIDHTMGFWTHIIEPGGVIFEYSGTPPMTSQRIQLYPGWNLVGYPSLTSHHRTDGLNNTEFGTHIDVIYWYDASTRTWHNMQKSDYFERGRGYWIHSKVEITWDVPL